MASMDIFFSMKMSTIALTHDLYGLDQGIFLAKILGLFIEHSHETMPLMASKYILFLNKSPPALVTWFGF